MSRQRLNTIIAVTALVCGAFAAEKPTATKKYQAYLSPMPHHDVMHPLIKGKGNTVVTLTDDTVSLNGTFAGLASPATKAHLCVSMAAGIPGKPVIDLVVQPRVEGNVTGTVKLDKDQAMALQKGQLYIQIDSEKAPGGNLWGWLLPEHETVGPDVPQKGPWFLPEFAVKTR